MYVPNQDYNTCSSEDGELGILSVSSSIWETCSAWFLLVRQGSSILPIYDYKHQGSYILNV